MLRSIFSAQQLGVLLNTIKIPVNGYEKYNYKQKVKKRSLGKRELSRLSRRTVEFNGWIRKVLCNRLMGELQC